jgi:hypothetical protein
MSIAFVLLWIFNLIFIQAQAASAANVIFIQAQAASEANVIFIQAQAASEANVYLKHTRTVVDYRLVGTEVDVTLEC